MPELNYRAIFRNYRFPGGPIPSGGRKSPTENGIRKRVSPWWFFRIRLFDVRQVSKTWSRRIGEVLQNLTDEKWGWRPNFEESSGLFDMHPFIYPACPFPSLQPPVHGRFFANPSILRSVHFLIIQMLLNSGGASPERKPAVRTRITASFFGNTTSRDGPGEILEKGLRRATGLEDLEQEKSPLDSSTENKIRKRVSPKWSCRIRFSDVRP